MPKARPGPTGRARCQQESRSVSAALAGPRSHVPRCAAPDAYTFTDHARVHFRLRLRRPRHSGLDQYRIDVCSMFARMPRYRPAPPGIHSTARRPAAGQNGSSRHVLGLFDSSSRRINEQSSGLLIRGFGVQVPGGAPILTWGFTLQVVLLSELGPWWVQCGTSVVTRTGLPAGAEGMV